MNLPSESPQLDYAAKSPASRRQWVYWWLIAGAILFALYVERSWPLGVWQHSRVLYLQQQCLKHPIAPGIIVYSSGNPIVSIRSSTEAALTSEYSIPPYWTPTASAVTVFAGELRNSGGLSRIVTVEEEISWIPGKNADLRIFWCSAKHGEAKPARGDSCASDWDTTVISPGDVVTPPSSPEVEIRSAVVDPNDASHISFTTRIFNYTWRSEGHLKSDGTFVLTTK